MIDTPGANEAGQEQRLETVVRKQLEKSAIVLIIIDFSKIGSTDDKKIKAEVETVRSLQSREKNKKQNLYVLVNYIDKRGRDARTPEQIKEYVKNEYGIGSSDEDKVFEIAAHWALFSANFFLQELDQDIDKAKADIKERPDIARDLLGAVWEEDIEAADLEKLKRGVRRLRKQSGFDEFLKVAIEKLMLLAAPQSMLEALERSNSHLEKIPQDVEFQIKTISQEAEKLQEEIAALQNKIDRLELCRNTIKKEIERNKKTLNNNLTEILDPLKQAAPVSIYDYSSQESISKQLRNLWRTLKGNAKDIFRRKLADIESFEKWMNIYSDLQFKFNDSQLVEFDSEDKAQEFGDLCVKYATERTEKLFDCVREITEQEIESSLQEVTDYLNTETTQIIEDARAQLQKKFDLEIPLPPSPKKIEVDLTSIKAPVEEGVDTQEEWVYKTYRPWYFLWLIKKRKPKLEYKNINTYAVSLENFIPQINEEIKNNIDRIRKNSREYIETNFEQAIDSFFKNLEGYLGEYQDFMSRSIETQKLSEEEQKQIVDNLKNLATEAKEETKKLNTNIDRTKFLLN